MTKQRTFLRLRVIVGLLAVLTVAASPAYAQIPPTPDWTWAKTGELTPARRQGFTATLVKLPGVAGDQYPVLVVGGYYPLIPDPKLPKDFDPVTKTQVYTLDITNGTITGGHWATGGPILSTPRQWHTATDLGNGRVLVAGGCDNSISLTPTNNCEILNLINTEEGTPASLNTARYGHTATLTTLPGGGKAVLVVGGKLAASFPNFPPFANTSECYNVLQNSWEIANLQAPRYGHTATLLKDGRVLVVGGFKNETITDYSVVPPKNYYGPAIPDCEIYGPNPDNPNGPWVWTPVASLKRARGWHAATLLQDGRVLVTGGTSRYDSGTPLDSYEIYDPGSKTWTMPATLYPDKHLQQARVFHQAILLKDGNVLVVGGTDPNGADPTVPQTSEIYQTDKDSWIYIQYGLKFPRPPVNNLVPYFSATLLDNSEGWVLVAGGGQTVCELFQPPAGSFFMSSLWSWKRTAAMATTEIRTRGHTATLLSDGRVLVAGGALTDSFGNIKSIYNSTPIYSVSANQWQTGPSLSLAEARLFHTATPVIEDNASKVLVTGGLGLTYVPPLEIKAGSLASCELYDEKLADWSPAASLPGPRAAHTATPVIEDNADKALVAGGANVVIDVILGLPPTVTVTGNIPTTTDLYNPNGTWTTAASQLDPGRIFHTATPLTNGKVLVVGGVTADIVTFPPQQYPLSSCMLYDPGALATQKWSSAASLHVARGMHTATLLANGKVLVAGGQGDSGALDSYEIYDPGSNTWTMPDATLQPDKHLQILRAGHTATLLTADPYSGMVLVAGPGRTCEIYNPDNGMWLITRTGFNETRNGQTATLLGSGKVFVVGGESTTGDGEIFGPKTLPSPPPLQVDIDIKPGVYPNTINLSSKGTVPVAILSATNFDASQRVAPTTLTFAGAPVALKGKKGTGTLNVSIEDVNGDGLLDMVLHFDTQSLQLNSNSTEAILTGKTYDGRYIGGKDSVQVLPKSK